MAPTIAHLALDIRCAAESDLPILITGSRDAALTMARLIHHQSRRRHGPFVPVDCSRADARPADEAGCAPQWPAGGGPPLAEKARGGTLLMEEVGAMSPVLQNWCLELLTATYRNEPGRRGPTSPGIRIMATSSTDLVGRSGREPLRDDLLYRLNTIHIVCPEADLLSSGVPEPAEV